PATVRPAGIDPEHRRAFDDDGGDAGPGVDECAVRPAAGREAGPARPFPEERFAAPADRGGVSDHAEPAAEWKRTPAHADVHRKTDQELRSFAEGTGTGSDRFLPGAIVPERVRVH